MMLRSAIWLAAMLIAAPGFAHAQEPLPPWWPCHKDGPASPEQSALINRMLPGLAETDRLLHFAPGTSRAQMEVGECEAEADPNQAAAIARAWGLPPDWAKPDRKKAAAVAEIQREQAATPTSAPKPWYTYNKNETKCFQGRSPAERVAEIQSAGDTTETRDYGSPSDPSKVDVIEDNGDGTKTVYTYWPSLKACEQDLPRNHPIDPKYR